MFNTRHTDAGPILPKPPLVEGALDAGPADGACYAQVGSQVGAVGVHATRHAVLSAVDAEVLACQGNE